LEKLHPKYDQAVIAFGQTDGQTTGRQQQNRILIALERTVGPLPEH